MHAKVLNIAAIIASNIIAAVELTKIKEQFFVSIKQSIIAFAVAIIVMVNQQVVKKKRKSSF